MNIMVHEYLHCSVMYATKSLISLHNVYKNLQVSLYDNQVPSQCIASFLPLKLLYQLFVSWKPEGRYKCSTTFHWEPEGRYHCTKHMMIASFWFSTVHLWRVIAPFWLSIDVFILHHCGPLISALLLKAPHLSRNISYLLLYLSFLEAYSSSCTYHITSFK